MHFCLKLCRNEGIEWRNLGREHKQCVVISVNRKTEVPAVAGADDSTVGIGNAAKVEESLSNYSVSSLGRCVINGIICQRQMKLCRRLDNIHITALRIHHSVRGHRWTRALPSVIVFVWPVKGRWNRMEKALFIILKQVNSQSFRSYANFHSET